MTRIVWFLHFHKCAGTSLIKTYKKNGYSFYPNHVNGNPADTSGLELDIWNKNKDELSEFIDDCHTQNVNFIASEWGVPDLEYLATREDVITVAIFREPLERFVSNFNFDIKNGFTKYNNVFEYIYYDPNDYTSHNFYTKMLCSKKWNASLSEKDLKKSFSMLSKINKVYSIQHGMDFICSDLGLQFDGSVENKTDLTLKGFLVYLYGFQFSKLFQTVKNRNYAPDESFKKYFLSFNDMDYALYNSIKKGG